MGLKISDRCPFFTKAGIDFDENGDIEMKVGAKIYLNAAKTMYLLCGTDTLDFYVGSAKKGEMSVNGYQAV